jgi:hypothetical protein
MSEQTAENEGAAGPQPADAGADTGAAPDPGGPEQSRPARGRKAPGRRAPFQLRLRKTRRF